MHLNEKIREKEELFSKVVDEIKKREDAIINLQNEIKQLEVQAYQIQGAVAAFNELKVPCEMPEEKIIAE